MKALLISIPFLLFVAIASICVSIWIDHGSSQWLWFQRSGSVVALIGVILGYRSIVRLGERGVGGANPSFLMGKISSVDDSGPIQRVSIKLDGETRRTLHEASIDSKSGYIGAFLVIVGTLIWGYGDLFGKFF